MIRFKQRGNFNKTEKFLKTMKNKDFDSVLERYAREGVQALAANTPTRSGKTAASWDFEIKRAGKSAYIYWTNSNINDGVNIAVIIQYGHGTGTGGYVQGIDYINPALRPVFEKMANEIWREVTSA